VKRVFRKPEVDPAKEMCPGEVFVPMDEPLRDEQVVPMSRSILTMDMLKLS